jgi:hypothetical protein
MKKKKIFIFWYNYSMKKKIIQQIKKNKRIKTPNNTKKFRCIFGANKKEEKSPPITIRKENAYNSLIDFKLNGNNNPKTNEKTKIKNYPNQLNSYRGLTEKNNSMTSIKKQNYIIENNTNIKQYNKNNRNKKMQFFYCFHKSINMDDDKKIFYFNDVINLIDNHRKKRKIRKYFNIWKTLIKNNNARNIKINKIEEKIINFKSLKSPLKNNLNENKNALLYNNSQGNINCQNESGDPPLLQHHKANSIVKQQNFLAQNQIEESINSNLLNSNSPKIIYKKKFLKSKQVKNQSINSQKIVNMDLNIVDNNNDNNKEYNLLYQNSENNLYNKTIYMKNKNNDLNSINLIRRSFNDKNDSDQVEKINRFDNIGKCYMTNTKIQTAKKNIIVERKNLNNGERFIITNNNTPNVIDTYMKNDLKEDDNKNIINKHNKNQYSGITTKHINLTRRINKNNANNKEERNNNQSF